MKIFLHEIHDQETELNFTQEEKWVTDAVARVDEQEIPDLSTRTSSSQKVRPARAHFSLRKVDEVIVISGNVETYIQLICSRCASAYQFNCNPSFSALFCKDPVMAGVAHRETGRTLGKNKGVAKHAHDFNEDEDVSEGKDLDITYLSEDYINLAEVLTEQLQLQVPFQPLCKENCKGICPQCGADLNTGRCACSKLSNHRPFSVLRDYKS